MSNGNFRELGLALNRLLMLKESGDLRQLNSDILDAKVRLELERDNYIDSKKEAKKWEDAVLVIEEQFSETGIALDKLNEQLGTPGGVSNLINNISEAETLSYSTKADEFDTKAEIYKERYKAVNKIIDEQIGLAKSIQSGGIITPILGASPTEWDPEDVGVEAYRHHVGLTDDQETPLIVDEYFKTTPEITNKELTRLSKEQQTYTYFEGRNLQTKRDRLKADGTVYFNRKLKNANSISSFDQILIGESLLQTENAALFEEYYPTPDQRETYTKNIQVGMIKFGTEFGTMLGDVNAATIPATYYNQYKTMIEQSTPETAKYQGVISPADYTMYNLYVQQTFENYNLQDTPEKKALILEYAQRYLGVPPNMTMERFVELHNHFYAGVTLAGFEGDPIDNIELPNTTEEESDPLLDETIFDGLE